MPSLLSISSSKIHLNNMRHIRLQLLVVLVGIGLVGLLLYGQSSGLSTRLVPAKGGVYNEGVVGNLAVLNPLLEAGSAADSDFHRLVYSGLLKFDSSGRPQPDLAQTWAASTDGLSYTLALRENLRWHDGFPLTIDDVIFTIQVMQSPDFPGAKDIGALWQTVGIQKLSTNTIKLELPQAYAPFPDFLTFAILPAHIYSNIPITELAITSANYQAIGSGALKLDAIERNQDGSIASVLLKANPEYYQPLQYLDAVRLVFFADEASAVVAFQQGQLQGLGNISRAAHTALASSNKEFNLYFGRLPEYTLIYLNQASEELPFFQSKRVRHALLASINLPYITTQMLGGHAIPATGPILPGTWAYDDTLAQGTYDPAWSAATLDAEGWRIPETALPGTEDYVRQKNETKFEFTWSLPDEPHARAIGELIASEWQKLGIRIQLEILPAAELQKRIIAREFEATFVSMNFSRSPDPDPYPFWHNTAIETGQNYSGYNNRRMSDTLEQARVTATLEDRAKLYRLFQQQFQSEQPALLLYYPVYIYAVDANVRNVQMGPLFNTADRFATIDQWYMLTRRVVTR